MNQGKRILVKYGKKEHLEQITKGKIRFTPSQVYVEMEQKLHNKGQGDLLEGKWIMHARNVQAIYSNGYQEFANGKITMAIQDVNNIPLFCLSIYDEEYINEEGEFVLPISKLESIKVDFPKATHALIIPTAESFIAAVNKAEGHRIFSDSIHYYNYEVNNCEMISYLLTGIEDSTLQFGKMSYENRYRHLFCKDISFENQDEYRFAVLDVLLDNVVELQIDYNGKYKLVGIDELQYPQEIN